MKILVAGEAIIDFLPTKQDGELAFIPKPGGSPLNVAVGLSRLGVPTGFLGKISKDPFGQLLYAHLVQNQIDTKFVIEDPRPSALAFVFVEPGGEPQFYFYGLETADMFLTPADLPHPFPTEVDAIHFGSLAIVRDPIATALLHLVKQVHSSCVVSFDPNIRPSQIPDRPRYLQRWGEWLQFVDILKLSQSDIAYLRSDENSVEELVHQWLKMGPSLVVVTQGAQGALAFTSSEIIHVKPPKVRVVDTVGAGDAFTAGFLAKLFHLGCLKKEFLRKIELNNLRQALEFATKVAAFTCTRKGADPPWLAELENTQYST